MDLYSRLKDYETDQNEKRILKPSGYAYRANSITISFMCDKQFFSTQGFADHVKICSPEDDLHTIVPKELVLGGSREHLNLDRGKDE